MLRFEARVDFLFQGAEEVMEMTVGSYWQVAQLRMYLSSKLDMPVAKLRIVILRNYPRRLSDGEQLDLSCAAVKERLLAEVTNIVG